LHGFPSGEELTDTLAVRCRKYYGVAGREFQRRLVESRKKDPKQLRKSLAGWRKEYTRALKAECRTEKLKPLPRSTGRCATVYAAGRLAKAYNLVPWDRQALLEAILSCQVDGLRYSQSQLEDADTSVDGLRRKLVRYLTDHRKEFRKVPRLGKHTLGSARGYVATFKGKKWFYLTADQLTGIIGSGGNGKELKRELSKNGLLATRPNGNPLVQRPVLAGATARSGHNGS
jgi:hypothetical protein